MSNISSLASVDPAAKIGSDVSIGPFCVIGPDVVIGNGCKLINNVTIGGITRIGSNNVFYQNVVVGEAPQDLKYDGSPTETIIGSNNVFRENCTVHRGTELGGGITSIGNNNLIMCGAHIAHDCILANKVLLGNQSLLAGHVTIEEGAVISALIGIHHFVTIGKFSYIAGMTPVRRDVPPFVKFSGDPNQVRGLNEEGLKRHNFSPDDIAALKEAYKKLFRKGNAMSEQLNLLQTEKNLNPHVCYLCEFMQRSCSSRFGRYQETARQDDQKNRRFRKPAELRNKE